MGLRVCVLASGSRGNCVFVASPSTAILIDAGLSGKETGSRLAAVGLQPAQLAAVCVTHEHEDHRAALAVLQRQFKLPLYANSGTIEAMERDKRFQGLAWNVFTTGQAFHVGDLAIEPFSVPHDSYDPVGFVVSDGTGCIGVATDVGMATSLIRERLRRCGVLVLESNHDVGLLRDAARPWHIKQRIAGRQGHFSNTQAAELLAEIGGAHLRAVFLAHLSSECNRPELALRTIREALTGKGWDHVAVHMTWPDRVSETVELG